MAQPGQFQVGQLYRDGYINGLKVYSQPGGPGTPVFPQFPSQFPWFGARTTTSIYTWPASFPAQYYWPCGHAANTAEIFSYGDPYEEEVMALICCSMCGYIVEIMPLSEYQNYLDVPIVTA